MPSFLYFINYYWSVFELLCLSSGQVFLADRGASLDENDEYQRRGFASTGWIRGLQSPMAGTTAKPRSFTHCGDRSKKQSAAVVSMNGGATACIAAAAVTSGESKVERNRAIAKRWHAPPAYA